MPLKNSQYDILMREYNQRQLINEHERQRRVQEIYEHIPRIAEIDRSIRASAASHARKLISGDDQALYSMRLELERLKREKALLLTSHGYAPDFMELHYTCPDCKDTGYIGSEKCHCLKQAAVDLLYTQSNIKDALQRENFSVLDMSCYSREPHPKLGKSVYEDMKGKIAFCRAYAASYGTRHHDSILFTGTTGVGKTFLSNCIAGEVLNRCHSVIYLTATDLFDIFSRATFRKEEDGEDEIDQYILDSDLLIIDDLGTEFSNSFTTGKLFYCINERLVRQKGTIISTNLSVNELRDMYSERVISRILSSYHILELFGDDIRIQKKFRR